MGKVLYYEAGAVQTSMVALTDSGDHANFNSAAQLWSDDTGRAPIVRVNGVVSGGVIIPAVSGSNDVVDVAEVGVNLNGVDKTGANAIAADTDVAITRDGSLAYKIHSITVNASGAIAVVGGTAHASAFVETRGAAGGPPLIPVDSVEIGQVRTTSTTAAPITADEIFQVPGTHKEIIQPYTIQNFRASNGVLGYAGIEFSAALPLIHTGPTPAKVYAQYYTPQFAKVTNVKTVSPPSQSGSVSSEATFDGALASESTSIGTGSFEAVGQDGVSDAILAMDGRRIFWKYKPDELKFPYAIWQGRPFFGPAYEAEGNPMISATITSIKPHVRITG